MGQIVKFFRSYLICIIYILFIYPKIRKMANNKDKYTYQERYDYIKKKASTILSILKVKIEVTGLENIEGSEKALLVPNHNSLLDCLLLIVISEKPIIFVAKKELEKKFIFGGFARVIDSLFLDRNDLRQSLTIIEEAKKILNNGHFVAVFPEGTRNKTNSYNLLEFKPGSFKTAIDTNSDIAPIVMVGTKDILSKKINKSYYVRINVLKVLNPDSYNDLTSVEISKNVSIMMNEKIKEMLQ